ncbi:hypothetical protein MD484_g9024, partial [Candolleomyces efflorescens]
MQAKASGSASRNQVSREERDVLEEIARAMSPRPKGYTGIGLGMPSRRPVRAKIPKAIEQTGPASAITPAVGETDDVPDSDEEEGAGPSGHNGGDVGQPPLEEDEDSEYDEDWTTDEESETGSSEFYSVATESLGYITSEEGSVIGEVVNQAIIEASLEGLKMVDDSDIAKMDRARKRLLLRNTELLDLRRLQRKKMIDEIDVGTILLDRLDQDLRRIGLNATSLLRLLELTGVLLSGSFVLPVLSAGMLVPNDMDLFACLGTYHTVISYLRKKGYTDCKQIYSGRRGRVYGKGLPDISMIFEVRNKKTYKINIIVSVGKPLLPILQFHSTPVMNYIAHHGVVCLYDLTIYRLGIANYMNDIPIRVELCFDKYRQRGIEIWDKLDEEHICRIDSGCPQTIRSLFDRDVVHIRFPDFMHTPAVEHRKCEADIAIWRLATGAACNSATVDELGFVVCEDAHSVLRR